MSLQAEVTIETPISVGRANNMWVIGGAGSYLDTITKRKGQLVVSYDSTGGKVQWHLYIWDDVAIAWVDASNPVHNHTSASTGGEAFEIFVNNPNLVIFNGVFPDKADFIINVNSGTGSAIANNTGNPPYVDLDTGTTTTGYATVASGGIPIDFAAACRWEGTWMISAITNVLFRWGLGTEDPNAASDNTHKLGIEWCDSQATSNYYTLSANGTSRSLVDSGVALAAATEHGCKIIYFPASKGEYEFWNGTIYNKTGILPSGVVVRNNVVRWGLKNNNGGSVNRQLDIRGTYMVGKANLTTWPL